MSRPAPSMRTKATGPELRLAAALKAIGASGFALSPQDVCDAAPDLYFRNALPDPVAIYVDGCQWHGCPAHFRPHRTAKGHGLTLDGVRAQRRTDAVARAALRAKGTKVLSFWEHEIAGDAARCARDIRAAVG